MKIIEMCHKSRDNDTQGVTYYNEVRRKEKKGLLLQYSMQVY